MTVRKGVTLKFDKWEEWDKFLEDYIYDPEGNLLNAVRIATLELSTWERVKLKLLGRVKVFSAYTPYGKIDFYLAKCPKCSKLFINYPHGYKGRLDCPRCDILVKLNSLYQNSTVKSVTHKNIDM